MAEAVTSLTYGIPTSLQGKQRSYHHDITPELIGDIALFCEAYNVSNSQFFLAIWALVQYRHTAATDGNVIFGVSGKDTTVPDSDSYVGFTEQQYPLKLHVQNELSALDWILEVSRVDQEAALHAFVGYSSIAREIFPLKSRSSLY